ncbi:OmpP1/FadL family transporter [Thermosulfurimonas dismutans]|uniref:Long-chain fatty acid transport protein n=1 Tax=Thermosulfurimonas dismutans TaxID=999894 RepID=A0A179D637_9BACT|nr:outer membrane protein transport protein [Thermosulfurimonas dismutans]OAQ21251.1 Long-chain fatty acid transport protein [Thermosulfurimonas dismutans]
MRKRLMILLMLWISCTGSLWAAGFQLFNEGSARVMGLGAAVTGRTDMVEAVWYNPSATAFFKDPEVMTGLALVMPSVEFESDSGRDYEMTDMVHPLPFLYAAYPLNDRFTLNFSFNVPYGLTTDWDGDWEGRYEAVYTSLRCYFFTPSIAVKLTDRLSFGFGAQVVYADAELRKYLVPGTPIKTKLTGDDWAAGWLVSLTYKIREDTAIGIIYRSQINLHLEGDAKYYNTEGIFLGPLPASSLFINGDGEVLLDLPDTLSVGITTRVIPRLTLSFDLLWSGWSTYDQLKFKYEYEPGEFPAKPGSIIQPKDWDDVLAVRFGVEYALSDTWTLRFGYVYDPSPIDDDTRGAELPTDDRQLFNFGMGYRKGNLGVNFAYTYLTMEDSHPGEETSYLRGTYEGEAHIVAFDLSYRF